MRRRHGRSRFEREHEPAALGGVPSRDPRAREPQPRGGERGAGREGRAEFAASLGGWYDVGWYVVAALRGGEVRFGV